MILSVFDILKIGVGPSSSHTLGPWNAARIWVSELNEKELLPKVEKLKVTLYGSLALTGKGHATDKAIILGLAGFDPETVDALSITSFLDDLNINNQIVIHDKHIDWNKEEDLLFLKNEELPAHPNAMSFEAYSGDLKLLNSAIFSSTS